MLKNTKKIPRLIQHPNDAAVACFADKYFLRTKDIVNRFKDTKVTYAVFMRRPVTSAPKLAVQWLEEMAKARETEFTIDICHKEGAWVGAGEPIVYCLLYTSPSPRDRG